jgi:hypothetical protein
MKKRKKNKDNDNATRATYRLQHRRQHDIPDCNSSESKEKFPRATELTFSLLGRK